MKFIDLFAGLGGFHQALARLDHTGVFACEIDAELRKLYKKNFGLEAEGDIRSIPVTKIPSHDILCAGFPCQPFSKAGEQKGLACPEWGNLFDYVLEIIRHHIPGYIMLENVPNLERHDDGRTWQKMKQDLIDAGYKAENIAYRRLSPHKFGIPQIRDRMFIVASLTDLDAFDWPPETPHAAISIDSILDPNPAEARRLSPQAERCLNVWQDFIKHFPNGKGLPSFPIWSMEFGASYPFEDTTPSAIGLKALRAFKGNHGCSLDTLPANKITETLPSYARGPERRFPTWKIQFIRQNREFYQENKKLIDKWLPAILEFPQSLQKFEWNCKNEKPDIWSFVIQFRASGVRVKRRTTAPSLIAMTTTQVPLIGWEKRYMTVRECARLQSMDTLKHLPETPTAAYRALGNAVNVAVVEKVARALLSPEDPNVVRQRRLPLLEVRAKESVVPMLPT